MTRDGPLDLLVLNWLDRENPRAGGAEIHLHECFGRLAAEGWKVTLVSSGWPGSEPRTVLDGIEVHRVGGRYGYAAAVRRYVHRTFGGRSFDLAVEDLNKVPVFLPRWSPAPVLLLVHHLFGATAFREAPLPVALATWLLERPIPRVYRGIPCVAVSRSTRDDLVARGLRATEIRVVENGIDPEVLRPGQGEARFPDPTLVYLGRLKRYKRVDLILRAVAGLRREGEAVRLLVAGDGDRRAALERLARRLGLGPGEVTFLGFVSEERKRELLQRGWVHTLTSEKEGWGISNLEAAACATPTVASDVPGLRDSVLHDRTGLLVPHGDVGALAEAYRRLLRDRVARERMGAAARAFAEGLTWDRSAARLAAVCREAVASQRASG